MPILSWFVRLVVAIVPPGIGEAFPIFFFFWMGAEPPFLPRPNLAHRFPGQEGGGGGEEQDALEGTKGAPRKARLIARYQRGAC